MTLTAGRKQSCQLHVHVFDLLHASECIASACMCVCVCVCELLCVLQNCIEGRGGSAAVTCVCMHIFTYMYMHVYMYQCMNIIYVCIHV